MDDPTAAKYRRAVDGFDSVIRTIPADKWEAQSPCQEWQAIDVVGHVIGLQEMVRARVTAQELSADSPSNRARAGSDPVGSWQSARDATLSSLESQALDRTFKSPMFGEMSVRQSLGFFIGDIVVHTWDLATAVGQKVRLDLELVNDCFAGVKAAGDENLRRSGSFGPEQPAPAGADEQTRLMAFLGRKVS